LYDLYNSYFSDFVLPFGCYFLLCANESWMPILRRWEAKSAIAFLIPSVAETCQYLGMPVLGATFDPLDYLMYGIGAIAAAAVDTQVFSRMFDSWTMERTKIVSLPITQTLLVKDRVSADGKIPNDAEIQFPTLVKWFHLRHHGLISRSDEARDRR
jgi:hypothetical protein